MSQKVVLVHVLNKIVLCLVFVGGSSFLCGMERKSIEVYEKFFTKERPVDREPLNDYSKRRWDEFFRVSDVNSREFAILIQHSRADRSRSEVKDAFNAVRHDAANALAKDFEDLNRRY